jgi:site-specific DNA recombinase
MVGAFVEEIVVYAKDRVEIKWKFKDEFGEMGKVEKDRTFGGEYGNGVV